jgi:hypothetical protein
VLPFFYVGEINSGALADVVYVICGAVVLWISHQRRVSTYGYVDQLEEERTIGLAMFDFFKCSFVWSGSALVFIWIKSSTCGFYWEALIWRIETKS